MVDVSIIIVNYNTKELTRQCIYSLFEHTHDINFEVIVVDNDSKDGSVELFAGDSRIVFIESGANLGFGKANNLGAERALGKYLFYLNSDTILLNNAIKMLFDYMEENMKKLHIGALGCLLLDSDNLPTHSFSDFPKVGRFLKDEWGDHFLKRFGIKMKRLDEDVNVENLGNVTSVDYVTGADIFVARDVINKYGGFDKDFFMYYEESEMQYRWRKLGKLHSYVIKGPQIVHLEGKSQSGQSVSKYLRQLKSQLLYFKKTCSPLKYYLYRVVFLFGRILTLPFQKFDKKQKKEYLNLLFDFM